MVPIALSPRVKRLGREADHMPPSDADGKNVWSLYSIRLHGMIHDNAQGQHFLAVFTFLRTSARIFRVLPSFDSL
jgi:hypothetical protein